MERCGSAASGHHRFRRWVAFALPHEDDQKDSIPIHHNITQMKRVPRYLIQRTVGRMMKLDKEHLGSEVVRMSCFLVVPWCVKRCRRAARLESFRARCRLLTCIAYADLCHDVGGKPELPTNMVIDDRWDLEANWCCRTARLVAPGGAGRKHAASLVSLFNDEAWDNTIPDWVDAGGGEDAGDVSDDEDSDEAAPQEEASPPAKAPRPSPAKPSTPPPQSSARQSAALAKLGS